MHITQQIKHPENDLFDMLMATDRLGSVLPNALRTEMVEWMAFCDFMYESIATDLGADDAKRKSRLIRVSLDGANSWWSGMVLRKISKSVLAMHRKWQQEF